MNFRKLPLLAAATLLFISAKSQTADQDVAQGLQFEKDLNEQAALDKYKEALSLQPDNLTALTRASLMCSRIGNRMDDKSKKTSYFQTAKIYADGALKEAPMNSDANLCEAVALGRMALISGAKQKVAALKEIKRYTELAIKYDPSSYEAWYLLGKWNYEVDNLNFFERAAANLLFGGVPKASLQDAITYYEKSRTLGPSFIQNYMELAKAYHKNNEDAKAIDALKKAISLRSTCQDDPDYKDQCKKMLADLE
jgi:tetratricopeptide (TPR) repeat protein